MCRGCEISPLEKDRMERRFKVADGAAVGAIIMCPTCKTRFEKRTRHHLFHETSCMHKYWSAIMPDRVVRTQTLIQRSGTQDVKFRVA